MRLSPSVQARQFYDVLDMVQPLIVAPVTVIADMQSRHSSQLVPVSAVVEGKFTGELSVQKRAAALPPAYRLSI